MMQPALCQHHHNAGCNCMSQQRLQVEPALVSYVTYGTWPLQQVSSQYYHVPVLVHGLPAAELAPFPQPIVTPPLVLSSSNQASTTLESVDLNRFYEQRVQLKRTEMTETLGEVRPMLDDIMGYVSKRDSRFTKELIRSGSYYQGLKVSKPDEFDFMVRLNIKKLYRWCPARPPPFVNGRQINHPPPGYCFVDKPTDDDWDESYRRPLDDAGLLTPFRVKQEFQRLVGEAIEACGLRGTVRFANPPMHGPAITIVIKTRKREVDVDLVPAAICLESGAGLPSCIPWPHGGASWPSNEKAAEVQEISCHFVPKKDYYWHMSTAAMERALLSDVDEDGGCRKKCQRILKKLREDYLCPDGDGINSYHLKTALLWELEERPRPQDWDSRNIVQRFIDLFQRVLGYVETGRCRHFFIDGVNLLKKADQGKLNDVAGRMRSFLQNPKQYLAV